MTELIWEGKYDAQGRKVGPRIALPCYQTKDHRRIHACYLRYSAG